MPLLCYHPEMGEARPEAPIEASLSHYGRHYFLRTRLNLKGRGVTHMGVLTESRLVPGSRLVGWNEYKVTTAAFERICSEHDVSSELLL
jgi:hypothetical protein